MYTAVTEMNAQTFIPQIQNTSKSSQPKNSFQDVMKKVNKEADKDQDISSSDKQQPQDDLVAAEKPQDEGTDPNEVNLLMQQMAASMAVPVIPAVVESQPAIAQAPVLSEIQPADTAVTEQLMPVQQSPMEISNLAAATVTAEELPQPMVKTMTQGQQTDVVSQQEQQQTDAQQPIVQKVSTATADNSSQGDTAKMQQDQMNSGQQIQDTEDKPELKAGEQQVLVEPEKLDLSKVNVKVGEGPVQANSPKLAEDLADRILFNAKDGKMQFDLELNPGDLGTIRIKLVFEAGKASVVMSCSNPKTEQMLMATAEQIRSIIQDQTGSDTQVHVKQEANQPQQDMEGRGENPNKRQQQQEQRNDDTVDAAVFLQQLKLGLVGKEE